GGGLNKEEVEAPLFLDAGGTKLAIVNFAEGEGCRSVNGSPGAHGFDPATAGDVIRSAKRQADVVIAIYHGGREYSPVPPPYVVSRLRMAAEGGADAVIAHHPHVPQGIEIYNGVPI